MRKQVWYGFSQKDNRTHFLDTEPKGSDNLIGTGSFTIDGEVEGLRIETVQQQGAGQRQPERA